MALDLDVAPAVSSYDRFLAAHPAYARTAALDALRASDFARLDASNSVYLDFTGAGLPAASHMREHAEHLAGSVFGNPHSASPSSSASTAAVERTRARVLDWFNGTGAYTCVFTLNASNALKLTAQDLKELGVIDEIVPEPFGGAHRRKAEAVSNAGDALERALDSLRGMDGQQLKAMRREKFLAMGREPGIH